MATEQTPRQKIEAEIETLRERRDAAQARANDEQRESDRLTAALGSLMFALNAIGPAPHRGRPAAGNGAQPAAPRARKARTPTALGEAGARTIAAARDAGLLDRTAGAEDRE